MLQDSPRVPSLSPQTPPVVHSPKVQAAFQPSFQHSPHQFYQQQQQSPSMIPVQSPRLGDQEGPKKVLEKLLDGSPAAVQVEAAQDMPILETTR